jgi:hypothetical protein
VTKICQFSAKKILMTKYFFKIVYFFVFVKKMLKKIFFLEKRANNFIFTEKWAKKFSPKMKKNVKK